MEKATLKVKGMACGHCEIAVQDAVRSLSGIKKVKANQRKGEVVVAYDPAMVTKEHISQAINDTGYQVV
ncbi:MAG: copper ion binding protein [Coriobacteriales bacterium]|nr:copper ion binding protein [Coriobacteriales bacterium]